MGAHDNFESVQYKGGNVTSKAYKIGDTAPPGMADGIYFGNEGAFVIAGGVLVAMTDKIHTKRGVLLPYRDVWDHLRAMGARLEMLPPD